MSKHESKQTPHRANSALDAAQAEIKRLETALGGARIVNMGLFVMCIIFIPVMSGVSYMAGMDRATSTRSQNTRAAHAQSVDWSKWTPSLACDVRRTQYSVVTAEHLVEHLNARAGACVNGANQSTSHVVLWRNRVCIEYASPETQCLIECASPSTP